MSTYFGKIGEIESWLKSRYPDLDILVGEQESKDIVNNQEYGYSEASRLAKLAKAKTAARVMNWSGGISALWAMFWPQPYELVMLLLMALPIACFFVIKKYNGLIRVNQKKGSAYPTILWCLLSAALAVVIRMDDFSILNYESVWLPVVSLTLLLTLLFVIGNPEFIFNSAKDYLLVLTLLILCPGSALERWFLSIAGMINLCPTIILRKLWIRG